MKIGIDPGVTGAIAALTENITVVHDMPVFQVGKKQQINPYELHKVLWGIVSTVGLQPVNYFRGIKEPPGATIYLEQVAAMPGQGVSSMFNFGVSFGIIQGVIASLGVPAVLVTPASWKRRAKLTGKPKDEARTLAQRLYPGIDLSRKKDVGRADAILIARFGSEVK